MPAKHCDLAGIFYRMPESEMRKYMTHNIACCYLTHNHPDVVKRVLGKVLNSYDENGICMIRVPRMIRRNILTN